MRLHDFYYLAKPTIPRRLQIAVRRQRALGKRKAFADTWPIDPRAGEPPVNWEGWPRQKKFALVLSHDVDSARGHDRCLQLVEVEEDVGFRSSFNFVPEAYSVAPHLRERIVERGFEISVHGLVHDGKLFRSRKIFDERCPRINQYLRDWKAVGFHSPSMLNNLEWAADLDIEYDCSTFDTDPFEPQPNGAKTIFPFWVKVEGKGRSYVELPYTLPQDHCLFIILREKDNSMWKKKLDWIAERGGMALLNTHPDYMNFGKRRFRSEEYPVSHYTDFLEYAKTKYEGNYWNPLPREVSKFWGSRTAEGKGDGRGKQ